MEQQTQKPEAILSGQDGNVFNLIGICSKALKRAGMHDQAKEMTERVFGSKSYEDAIAIMGEYCELS